MRDDGILVETLLQIGCDVFNQQSAEIVSAMTMLKRCRHPMHKNEPAIWKYEHRLVLDLSFFYFFYDILFLSRCSHHRDEQQTACAYANLSDGGGEGEV